MMLLNGAVLGFVHRDLPATLRPAADSWRVATLLMAGGSLLMAVQDHYTPGFILPLSNGLLMVGLTLYWRSLRRFYGRPDHWLMLLPTPIAVIGIYWFSALQPDLAIRIAIATVCWLLVLGGSLHVLGAGLRDTAVSRRVMTALFVIVGVFIAARGVWFVLVPDPGVSLVDTKLAINVLTPLVVAVLPVIGTTVFLLMCSERILRQWEQAASTDHLTGLANRRTLGEESERRLAASRERALALALIDIDHFKRINDAHGHEVGDHALRHVAMQLRRACRDGDLAARHGGEEFVVLFEHGDNALAVAERLRAAVEATPFVGIPGGLSITVSVGVARRGANDRQLDDLLRRADRALYRAKAGGRNRVELEVE